MTNPVKQLTSPIVGAHFRPPAKVVLERLASGTPLRLQAEPTNDYDPNAVQVWVKPSALPAERQVEGLAEALALCGWEVDELFQLEELQLGYLPREGNKQLLATEGAVSNEVFLRANELVPWAECQVMLTFGMKGEPLVLLVAP